MPCCSLSRSALPTRRSSNTTLLPGVPASQAIMPKEVAERRKQAAKAPVRLIENINNADGAGAPEPSKKTANKRTQGEKKQRAGSRGARAKKKKKTPATATSQSLRSSAAKHPLPKGKKSKGSKGAPKSNVSNPSTDGTLLQELYDFRKKHQKEEKKKRKAATKAAASDANRVEGSKPAAKPATNKNNKKLAEDNTEGPKAVDVAFDFRLLNRPPQSYAGFQ